MDLSPETDYGAHEQCDSASSDSSMDNIFPNMTIVLTGNSLAVQFGHENILLGEEEMNTEDTDISRIVPVQRQISECHVSVINMTGLHKAELSLDSVNYLTDQLVNENEIHAFIFVVRLGQLTDSDKMGLEWLQRVFGDKVLQFVMILFTYEREEECDTIIDDLKKNPVLEQLLKKCGGRYHTCNQMMNKQSEMIDLMNKIERLFNENEQQCYTSEMDPNAKLNLILLGKKQVGKSASGNTILGRESFVSKKSSKSVTQDVAVESGNVSGFQVTVYDTPGLFEQDMREEEIQQLINEKVLQKCESGPCVFLLVIKPDSFTTEERKTVEKIEKLLGETCLDKTWILFTRGDELEEENMTIQEFINENEQLKKLVEKYDQRYHVFNNNERESSDQARLLLLKIIKRSQGVKGALTEHGYTIEKELGQGVSGEASLVKSPEEDLYVVKEINCRDKRRLDTVKKEINILKNLHHGYIVSYEKSFEDKDAGFFYVVMEYCAGRDLHERMKAQKERGIFEEQQIHDWLVQICLALQYLHQKNVLHRDIKPQNVFLTEDGYINLGYFGYSKVLKRRESDPIAELYISAEVLQERYNSKSDIWSLGWLLHDLCMLDVWSNVIKRRCIHSNSLMGTTPEISEKYSEDLQKLIKEMLSCNPKDRPSADEILAKPFLKTAVNRNRRIPEALEQRVMKSIEDFNGDYDEHYEDFKTLVREWGEITDSMESVHYSATAGTLSGSVIGAAGGITTLVGVILAPFTLGASLIVTGVGIGIGVAGGVAGAASSITNAVKQKSLRENIERIKQQFENVSKPILSSLNTVRMVLKTIQKFSEFFNASTNNVVQKFCYVGQTKVRCATELMNLGLLANFGRIAAQTTRVGRVAAEAVSGVLSVLLVIVDTAFIVKDSREIHQMRTQWKTDDPEKVTSSVLKSIAQMRKTHKDLCIVLEEIKKSKEELSSITEVPSADSDLDRDLKSLNI